MEEAGWGGGGGGGQRGGGGGEEKRIQHLLTRCVQLIWSLSHVELDSVL